MKLSLPVIIATLLVPAGNTASASQAGIRMLHSVDNKVHCYRIINNAGKPVEEITLGFTWAGYSMKDNLILSINEQPEGWEVERIKRPASGFQYYQLKLPNTAASGEIGKFCFRINRNLDEMNHAPFSYLLKGDQYRTATKAEPDDGAAR